MGPILGELSRVLSGPLGFFNYLLVNLGWTFGVALIILLAAQELARAYYGRLPAGLSRLAYNIAIVVLLAAFGVALEARLLPILFH